MLYCWKNDIKVDSLKALC